MPVPRGYYPSVGKGTSVVAVLVMGSSASRVVVDLISRGGRRGKEEKKKKKVDEKVHNLLNVDVEE